MPGSHLPFSPLGCGRFSGLFATPRSTLDALTSCGTPGSAAWLPPLTKLPKSSPGWIYPRGSSRGIGPCLTSGETPRIGQVSDTTLQSTFDGCHPSRLSPLLRVFCSSALPVVTSSVPLIGAVRPPSGWGNLALFHRSGAVRRLSVPSSGLPLQTPHSVSSGGLSRLPGQPFPLAGSELDWRAFPGFSIRGAAGHLLVLLSWLQKRRPRRDVPILYQL